VGWEYKALLDKDSELFEGRFEFLVLGTTWVRFEPSHVFLLVNSIINDQ
jgi:hypothetical protein